MLTVKENERLTRVSAGTPMGELMRRYWQPIAAAAELDENPVKQVKLLGESLVLYRNRKGGIGLIGDTCAHRRISLLYGIPEEEGLRCPYHGWMYNETGQCIEMPAEAPDSTFPTRVKITGYPVQELAGLIFAYLGPEPVPLLPRWDLFVWDNVLRDIGTAVIPCNWLQIMENSLDPVHVEWLHGRFSDYVLERLGRGDLKRQFFRNGRDGGEIASTFSHEKIGFDEFQHGIIKRRVLDGRSEEDPEWRIGHPILFPNILRVGSNFQYRVPVDDTHTLHIWFTAYPQPPGEDVPKQETVPVYKVPLPVDEQGIADWQLMDNNSSQDITAWVTQGPIADRSQEKLGESDKGIILYRRMLRQQLAIMEDEGQPMNVFFDPGKNQCIDLPWEGQDDPWAFARRGLMRRTGGAAKYAPVLREMVARFDGEAALQGPVH
ncbi:MAG: Rieske 2Fe-2S domain-containing protein [Chloroflexi bacterium]|nr:Rieske 2Fe-2S domain-containing protein [Chloroflexota bacterium]